MPHATTNLTNTKAPLKRRPVIATQTGKTSEGQDPFLSHLLPNTQRRNDYDVTNRVKTTDPAAVNRAVNRIFLRLYPKASTRVLDRAFKDLARLHHGEYPGYLACDVTYHNLQHTLDVTLAMARLMDGHERSPERPDPLGPKLFRLGVLTALFHDIGYLRRVTDTRAKNGAEYTLKHITRGARFVQTYLGKLGMAKMAAVAKRIIHFTGYERPVETIRLPDPQFRMLGNLLGTADIIAQMSDRCYLEKCRDNLYPEFVAGGLASGSGKEKNGKMQFSSAVDLLMKTPSFYLTAIARLNFKLGAVHRYAVVHFKGQNLYLETIEKNVRFATMVGDRGDFSLLRRAPPTAPTNSVRRKT
ncbi:MAG: hypothetical protein ACKVP2_13700 [Burkholderiales bacterium]